MFVLVVSDYYFTMLVPLDYKQEYEKLQEDKAEKANSWRQKTSTLITT